MQQHLYYLHIYYICITLYITFFASKIQMKNNHLTQVVILFLLTIGILLGLSTLKPTDINFTTKEMDLLSSLRYESINKDSFEVKMQTTNYELNNSVVNEPNQSITKGESIPNEEIITPQAESNNHPICVDSMTLVMLSDSTTILPKTDVPSKAGNITLIEDYTAEQSGLKNLETVVRSYNTLQRPIRIAILGDSFTEADIMTQNIRQLLQDVYGGCGVGYMPMYSDCPGFRHSISHVCEGWETHSVISKPEYKSTSLTLQVHRPQDSTQAYTRYKGVTKYRHLDSWNVSKIGFIANKRANITVKTDSGRHSFVATPDNKAQFIIIPETTRSMEIRCSQHGVAFWGAWLDGNNGFAVDNISVRGYSGTTIPTIPIERLKQLNEKIPYDLIILQYGLNCMAKHIMDYSYHTTQLVKAIKHLRAALPNTDFVIMGISDRCQNINGAIQTMKNVFPLRQAQRNAAIISQCHFWDCYEAMKTLGGMENFVNKKWANKDYTHISRVGGSYLAEEFINALKYAFEKKGLSVPLTLNEQ